MFNEDYELSEQERIAIAALPRELAPGDLLEERVIRALTNEGHFGRVAHAPRQWSRQLMRVAAAIALFAGGVATGHYLLLQPRTAPQSSNEAQTVGNTETVVAEREMWL